jgi:hypothetical protein
MDLSLRSAARALDESAEKANSINISDNYAAGGPLDAFAAAKCPMWNPLGLRLETPIAFLFERFREPGAQTSLASASREQR